MIHTTARGERDGVYSTCSVVACSRSQTSASWELKRSLTGQSVDVSDLSPSESRPPQATDTCDDGRVTNALPWPTEGDPLFTSGHADWHNNACLNWTEGNLVHLEGYKLAADQLVRTIEAGGHDQDFLVYPIVFLYRHHLELLLKDLRSAGWRLYDWDLTAKADHKLPGLWKDCRKVIEETWPDAAGSDADVVEKLVAEFDAMDPNSTAFRYSTSMKGDKSLPDDLTHLNLRHLRETMDKLSLFLQASLTGVTVNLDLKQDMESSV